MGKSKATEFADGAELLKAVHADDWNDYVIEARGPRLRHTINGKLMNETVDNNEEKRADSGILALQVHQGPPMTVRFPTTRSFRRRYGEARWPLPIGSNFDPGTGTFGWQPGVGFVGRYEFAFTRADGTAQVLRTQVASAILGRKLPQTRDGYVGSAALAATSSFRIAIRSSATWSSGRVTPST